MNLKDVCQLDADGYFVGPTLAQADPMAPGSWILPPDAIDAPIPEPPAGCRARWDGAAWQVEPAPAAPPPTPEQRIASIIGAVQARLDAFARSRGYDSILSACSYAASTDPQFGAEGAYCVAARDAHWRTLYDLLAAVQAGTVTAPTVDADIVASLPPLEWPAIAGG